MDIKDIIINRRDFKIDGNEGMFEFFWKKKKKNNGILLDK